LHYKFSLPYKTNTKIAEKRRKIMEFPGYLFSLTCSSAVIIGAVVAVLVVIGLVQGIRQGVWQAKRELKSYRKVRDAQVKTQERMLIKQALQEYLENVENRSQHTHGRGETAYLRVYGSCILKLLPRQVNSLTIDYEVFRREGGHEIWTIEDVKRYVNSL
jgi:hypothetical protein